LIKWYVDGRDYFWVRTILSQSRVRPNP
jgi:hypothetical protein